MFDTFDLHIAGKVAGSISPGFVDIFLGAANILTQVNAAKLLGRASSEKAEEETKFPLRRRIL